MLMKSLKLDIALGMSVTVSNAVEDILKRNLSHTEVIIIFIFISTI